MFLQKLYVRIWLAVVLAVAVLTLLVGWAWRMAADPPLREVVVRNEAGEIIGNGHARWMRPPGSSEMRFVPHLPRPPQEAPAPGANAPPDDREPPEGEPHSKFGEGPEFVVRMLDGQTMHLHLPRPPQSSWKAPSGSSGHWGWSP